MEDHTFEVDASKFKGVKSNFYIAFTAADNVYVDAWQFSDSSSAGISAVGEVEDLPSASYDLSGRYLGESGASRGIVIEQYQDAKGQKHARKRVQ